MQIYINKKEIEAIRNAWEQVNASLEACSDDESINGMQEILKRLITIDDKCKGSSSETKYKHSPKFEPSEFSDPNHVDV